MTFVERHASSSTSRSRPPKGGNIDKSKFKSNHLKRVQADAELKELQARIDTFSPLADLTLFSQLPLSSRTIKGLKSSHFLNPTPIQSLAIPSSLQNRDVLGSAKTGSGKTLAFLIPVLERLYMLKWGPMDGLGAVVISPTRELAVQTFNQLRDIGKYHNFSAGLVIGGKPLKEERDRLGRMNILIATPGRLLQHLDSTVGFESAGLKILVLDEADRLLDLGFLPVLRAIVSHFSPSEGPSTARPGRQTLLFSATQSKDLASLARLSLHDPLYINCNKVGEEGVVPSNLEQYYSAVPLDKKLDALWGFVKSHLKMKGVVFVTSGKQVRFIFETFRRLHPGLPVMHLHGKQKQPTRLDIFQRFSSSKSALLICTDVAARGLDFPSVDWVIQLDCPDDVDTYIHRVGRTARYQSGGKALLFLCPTEEAGMLTRWKEKGLDVKNIKIKQSKMGNLRQQMQNFSFREPEIKYLGQRWSGFISYMRSIHFQKDKSIFKLSELPADAYAASMGLPGAPQIKFKEQGKAGAKSKSGGLAQAVEAEASVRDVVGSSDEAESDLDEDIPDVQDENDGGSALAGDQQGLEDEDVQEPKLQDDLEEDDDGDDEDDEDEKDHKKEMDNEDGKDELDDQEEEVGGGVSDDDEGSTNGQIARATGVPVRTKYDRMFQRKNQSILTPHYSALVAHDEDATDDKDEDVFTLQRADHELEGDDDDEFLADMATTTALNPAEVKKALTTSEDLSKRKLKQGASRKAQLKSRSAPEKVVFDETGEVRNFYEAGKDAEIGAGAKAKRQQHLEDERERMQAANQVDREVARDRRREKKRKRKEREKDATQGFSSGDDDPVAILGGGDDSHDAESADYDAEPGSRSQRRPAARELDDLVVASDVMSEDEDRPRQTTKKAKRKLPEKGRKEEGARGIEDEEELALRLLQGPSTTY